MKRRSFLQMLGGAMLALVASKVAAKLEEVPPNADYLTDPNKWYIKNENSKIIRVPPKTCEELYAAMNSVFPVGPSTERMWSVTGEEYVEHIDWMYLGDSSEEILCGRAWDVFLKKTISHDLDMANSPEDIKLYWCKHPEFWTEVEPEKAIIYMRYLISSMPQISITSGDLQIFIPQQQC